MVNDVCAFSQSELGKYFGWIVLKIKEGLVRGYVEAFFTAGFHWVLNLLFVDSETIFNLDGVIKMFWKLMNYNINFVLCSG